MEVPHVSSAEVVISAADGSVHCGGKAKPGTKVGRPIVTLAQSNFCPFETKPGLL